MTEQLDSKGNLGPVKDACVVYACREFGKRIMTEPDGEIVQMIHEGTPIDHWYFRSSKTIVQPFGFTKGAIKPYIGTVAEAPKAVYGPGTYIADQTLIRFARAGGFDRTSQEGRRMASRAPLRNASQSPLKTNLGK